MTTRRLPAGAAAILWVLMFGAMTLLDGPWSAIAPAQGRGGGRGSDRPGAAGSPAKSELFVVVQVGDRAEVVKKSEVSAFTKRLDEQHRAEVKAYEEARRNAAKEGEPFDRPPPTKPVVKVHPKTFKAESEAKASAESLQRKLAEDRTKAAGKNAEEFAVAEIDGQAKILRKSELAELKKKFDADHQRAMADFNDARKQAAKNKQPFDQPPPTKPVVKVLGPSFKTEAQASAFLEKLQAKKDSKSNPRSRKASE
ncbi:MAG: hypothetical protein JXQ29_03500 [Planctomycetes bacterium]|nr:hypothetical protein [Planctomycetota bacterium]